MDHGQHSSPTYTLWLPALLLPFAFLPRGKESLASPPKGSGRTQPQQMERDRRGKTESRGGERGAGATVGRAREAGGDLVSTGPGVPSPGLDKQLCYLLAHMAWAEPLDLSLSFPTAKWAPSTPPRVKLGGSEDTADGARALFPAARCGWREEEGPEGGVGERVEGSGERGCLLALGPLLPVPTGKTPPWSPQRYPTSEGMEGSRGAPDAIPP